MEGVQTKSTLEEQVKALRLELTRRQVLEITLLDLQKQVNHIVQRIKTALTTEHSKLRQRLAKNAVVCDMTVMTPFDTDNLSGIYQNLYNEFNKISIGFLCEFLLKLLQVSSSQEESSTNPSALVERSAPMLQQ